MVNGRGNGLGTMHVPVGHLLSTGTMMTFTPGPWEWSPENLPGAMYGRFSLLAGVEVGGH
jgi:hypothetical protein